MLETRNVTPELAIAIHNTIKKSKVSAGFHSRHFYSATKAVTAIRAIGVGYAATREKSQLRGSKPGRWFRS